MIDWRCASRVSQFGLLFDIREHALRFDLDVSAQDRVHDYFEAAAAAPLNNLAAP
jgi:hypothetical protein